MHPFFFPVFGFLWYCIDVLIYWGYCLSQNMFFKMVYVSGIASHLKFTFPDHFYINVTLSRLISLFMLIFFYRFCLGISEEDALLVKYLSCTMCIFLRNTGKHDMCSGQKLDNCLMLHFQIILFIQPAW